MSQIKPHTLSGFMELLPQPQLQMEAIMEVLRNTYSLYGFTPLDTPAIEAAGVLLAKGGGETEKQIYRFQKGDSDLALRFDLTVPLAKYVALHYSELAFPFRRYQIGKVMIVFYVMLGLSEQSGDIMRSVDKLDKIGSVNVRVLLVEECGVEETKADEILTFIAIRGTNGEVLSALEQYRGRNEVFDQGLDELSSVTQLLGAFGVPEENFAVDLTIARGLDYYTGTV